eukprot:UN27105
MLNNMKNSITELRCRYTNIPNDLTKILLRFHLSLDYLCILFNMNYQHIDSSLELLKKQRTLFDNTQLKPLLDLRNLIKTHNISVPATYYSINYFQYVQNLLYVWIR